MALRIWNRVLPDCPPALVDAADWAMAAVRPLWNQVDDLVLINQTKVLSAFQSVGIAEYHFAASTGYGYNDIGRERIEQLFATAMGAEAGLVRVQFASGTHAIACGLFGALRPGDRLIAAAGRPYDTLRQVIDGAVGSLTEWGVQYLEATLTHDGRVDLEGVSALIAAVPPDRGVTLFIQRSRGYSLRPSLTLAAIAVVIAAAKAVRLDCTIVVDNCYGEFVEESEPPQVGADLTCGSLIKNPGGGIAPTGGYVIGRRDLVERAAARLIAPGVGSEIGANLGMNRLVMQGFFLAPHVTGEALRGAQFTAALFGRLGFGVMPAYDEPRTDLVQAVELGSREALIAFCEAVQGSSPVDAHVRPEPWEMPGYTDHVIMAAGTFVQGSSIELSADGPMRPPYLGYFQGGLTREHVIWAALNSANELVRRGILRL